jgi:ATP-dependent DNA helicase PIF1
MNRALTIHKSQGQTIERVKIDLNKIFVEGKLFCTLDKLTNRSNIRSDLPSSQFRDVRDKRILVKQVRAQPSPLIANWNCQACTDDRVMAHPRVIKWAAPLEDAQANEEEWDDLLANHEFDEAL